MLSSNLFNLKISVNMILIIIIYIYKRFKDDNKYCVIRSNDTKGLQKSFGNSKETLKTYCAEFKSQHLPQLNQAFLQIVNSRQSEFVGTKTMSIACKFIGLSLKFKESRELIKPSIQNILFNISLPLFIATEKDLETFSED